MAVHRQTFTIETKGQVQAIDITDKVSDAVRKSGLKDGIACVFTPGSTAAIVANEFEPGLMRTDLPAMLERIAPAEAGYAHNERWSDDNGHSHVRSAAMGQSYTFPFGGGKPLLGTWQQLILLELDIRPRTRDVVVQLVGE